MEKFWNSLPDWGRGVVAIAGILAGAGIAYAGYKSFSAWAKRKEQENVVEEISKELQDREDQGEQPTHSHAQFEAWASSLQQAFDGCGTDDNAVNLVMMAMNNTSDVLKLIEVFKVRSYDGCDWAGEFSVVEKNLNQALSDELSGFEKAKINNYWNEKGIEFVLI